MTVPSKTSLLDRVGHPADRRSLWTEQLKQLAGALRAETIDAVSVTDDHPGASLGVVYPTVAFRAAFDLPRHRLTGDVTHQAHPLNKIFRSRPDCTRTLRQAGGISRFTHRAETERGAFDGAHSSTSMSAGLGMAVARAMKGGDDRHVIDVTGCAAVPGALDRRDARRPSGHCRAS